MRLTNNMMSKSYLKNLNNSLKELNESNTRITAQRRYMKISEDPATALKAMKVRKNLSRNDMYKENLSDAKGILDQYESTISNINDIVKEAVAQVMQGATGTSDDAVRRTVATTLRGYQETILAAANTKYGDDYIFGGAGVDVTPFTLNASNELCYNGQNVDTGTFEDEYRYIDIGIGLSIDTNGEVSPKSAFNISNSGSDLLGSGVDGNGISNNLYNLLGEIADKLENNDVSNIQQNLDKLISKADDIRLQYVSVGEKTNYIKYFIERLDSEKINSATKQNELESMNTAEGIIIFKEQLMAYNSCLQMGTKILQPSLMDFLR